MTGSIAGAVFTFALLLGLVALAPAEASQIPATEPQLFEELFSDREVPREWIEPAASGELTPAMLQAIAARLLQQGGAFENSEKTAGGWRLHFKNGQARARIVRSKHGRLIGVFFSDIE